MTNFEVNERSNLSTQAAVTPIQHSQDDATSIRLEDSERQPCEIWTRVMGYHRPVASFNPGKQSEHAERKFFKPAIS